MEGDNIATLLLRWQGGILYSPSQSIAFLLRELFNKGTEYKNDKEIATILDKYGVEIELYIGKDFFFLYVNVLAIHYLKILSLIREMIFFPRWPMKVVKKAKKKIIQSLKLNRAKAYFCAQELVLEKIFGNHPYGWKLDETTIKQTRVEDIARFFYKCRGRDLSVAMTGGINQDMVKKTIDTFNPLERTASSPPLYTIPSQTFETPFFLTHERSRQSAMIWGKVLPPLHRIDKVPELLFLNLVLGGYFGSLIMQKIREEKGYTYNIYSRFIFLQKFSFWKISGDVKKGREKEVIELVNDIFRQLREKKISSALYENTQRYWMGRILYRLSSAQGRLFTDFEQAKYGKSLNHYVNYYNKLQKFSCDTIREQAMEQLFPLRFACICLQE